MRHPMLAAALAVSALSLAACGAGGPTGTTPDPEAPTATGSAAEASSSDTWTSPPCRTTPSPPDMQPCPGGIDPGWSDPPGPWPTDDVSVPFEGEVPPVPVLIDVRAGTHPGRGFDRIAFEFEALPGYTVGYVSEVVRDGSGEPVDLPGEAFLQLVFTPAQAHDEQGESTLDDPPVEPVDAGHAVLDAYVLNGDYEGYVSIALGLNETVGFQVEWFQQGDGDYVVYVDLQWA